MDYRKRKVEEGDAASVQIPSEISTMMRYVLIVMDRVGFMEDWAGSSAQVSRELIQDLKDEADVIAAMTRGKLEYEAFRHWFVW